MSKINVLHLRDSSGIYGAERVILTLAKHIDKKIFNFHLIAFDNNNPGSREFISTAKEMGLDVIVIPVKARINIPSILRIRKIIKSHQMHIFHGHDFKSNFYGLLASAGLGIAKFVTSHGSTRDSFLKKIYLYLDERIFYRFFNIILPVSEQIQNHLIHLGLHPDKIKLVQNGIDISLISDQSIKSKNELGSLSSSHSILFGVVGRLFPDKGHSYFIEAFFKIVSEFEDVHAWFVGDGPSKMDLLYQIKNRNMINCIDLLGQKADMDSIYNRLDFIVIPSLREGLPYSLLESMSYKIPVLATNVGDIPKLIYHDVTGFLVPPKDEDALYFYMRKMILERNHVKQLADNAFNLVNEHFSANKMVRKIEKYYLQFGQR